MYDDDDEITDQLNGNPTVYKTITVDYKYRELKDKITKKIMDLQSQIIDNLTLPSVDQQAANKDTLRYTAMVEVLKAMLN